MLTKNGREQYIADCADEVENFLLNHNVIIKYVRDKKFKVIGVMIAAKDGNQIHYGWSKLHTQKDRWNRKIGLKLAIDRWHRATDGASPDRMPISFNESFEYFRDRAHRYFKVSIG